MISGSTRRTAYAVASDPEADKLPLDDPLKRYEEGDSYVGMEKDLIYFINPFADDVYYYQVEFDSKGFMEYAKQTDGTPNSVLAAIMLKTTARYFPQMPNQHISANESGLTGDNEEALKS